MTAEAPEKTLKRFSKTWKNTDFNSLLAEFDSIAKETNREPHKYHFSLEGNKLIDPNTGRPILDFIAEGVEKNIAKKLENWASETEEGMALWISPKSEGLYPCPKVIMHKIAYNLDGTKVLLNTVILFDAEIENPKYKRKTLYTLPDTEDNVEHILKWIRKKSREELNLEASLKTDVKKSRYFAEKVTKGISYDDIIDEMIQDGFLGSGSISCPISFSSLVESNANITIEEEHDKYGSRQFACPSCKAINTRPHNELIPNCLFCGADVRC
jgi:hypothetical protein